MAKKSIWDSPHLKRTLIALVLVVLGLAVVAYISWPFLSSFDSFEDVKQTVRDAGPWSPAVFMLSQVLQVVFAPIPGHITGFVGGVLYGTFWGTLLSMVGTTIGFTIVFVLSRHLGRPFVEYFVSEENLKKFDYLSKTKGVWVLFAFFLLPIVPDAIAGYAAGLTAIKIRVLLAISILGRLPGIYLLSLAGAETANANYALVGGVFAVSAILAAIAYLWRDRLEELLRRFSKKG